MIVMKLKIKHLYNITSFYKKRSARINQALAKRKVSGERGNRTPDTRIFSPLLYRLSYFTAVFFKISFYQLVFFSKAVQR
jgi:hypothetical protein